MRWSDGPRAAFAARQLAPVPGHGRGTRPSGGVSAARATRCHANHARVAYAVLAKLVHQRLAVYRGQSRVPRRPNATRPIGAAMSTLGRRGAWDWAQATFVASTHGGSMDLEAVHQLLDGRPRAAPSSETRSANPGPGHGAPGRWTGPRTRQHTARPGTFLRSPGDGPARPKSRATGGAVEWPRSACARRAGGTPHQAELDGEALKIDGVDHQGTLGRLLGDVEQPVLDALLNPLEEGRRGHVRRHRALPSAAPPWAPEPDISHVCEWISASCPPPPP